MTEKLTIGLPFFNNENTLIDAIKSIFAQTFQDWQLILVDDGSTDSSLNIVQNINDPRVKIISNKQNSGLPNVLNQITQNAKGIYIARMDADDLMHPQRLELQLKYLQDNPSVDVVGTGSYIIDHENTIIGIRGAQQLELKPNKVIREGLFIHPTITGKRDWFINNPYDPKYIRAEDKELWCRVLGHSNLSLITRPLFFYRDYCVNLHKYSSSCRTDRKIFKKYGPKMIGTFGTLNIISLSYLKNIFYHGRALFGLHEFFKYKRNQPLDCRENNEAQEIFHKILNTPVPGI